MKKRKPYSVRMLAVFVSCFLMVQYTPQLAAQADSLNSSEDIKSSDSLDIPAEIVREDSSLREENVKHFQLSDGSYTAVVYDEPVHYLKETEWTDIDNTLSEAVLIGEPLTGTVKKSSALSRQELQNYQSQKSAESSFRFDYLENTDNDFKVQLPVHMSSDAPVMVSYGGHTLRFQFENIASVRAETIQPLDSAALSRELQNKLNGVTNTEERAKIKNEQASTVTKSRSAVSYDAVQPGMDLQYYVSGKKLKEDLILHRLPEAESFTFAFTYTGLRAVLEEDKSVTFQDEAGEAVFTVASPYMFDMEDNMSADIAVTVEETATGCLYTLTPSRAWLEDPARAYPVTLDPSMEPTTQNASYIQDAGVQESNPKSNYQKLDRIYVGTYWDDKPMSGRMYFNLSQWPSVAGLSSATITNATLHLNYYHTATYQSAYNMWIDVLRVNSPWNSGDITWENQVNIEATFMSDKYLADSRKKTSGVDEFDVTAWVKARYSSPSTNYGIRLQPYNPGGFTSTNRACYISSDYSTMTLRPLIKIEYNPSGGEAAAISNEIYYIRNVQTGKYLDLIPGTTAWLYPFNGSPAQQWKVTTVNGITTLTSMYNQKALDARYNLDVPYPNVWDYTPNGSACQKWRLVDNGNGTVRIMSEYKNSDSIGYNATTLWADLSPILNDSKKWVFERVETATCSRAVTTIPPDDFQIRLDHALDLHNSMPLYEKFLANDRLNALYMSALAAAVAAKTAYPNAADALLHYLNNTGADYTIPSSFILSAPEIATKRNDIHNDLIISGSVLRVNGLNVTFGQKTHIEVPETPQSDWRLSWNKCDLWGKSTISANGVTQISLQVRDVYDYEPDGNYTVLNVAVSSLYDFNRMGWAKPFAAYGNATLS